MLRTKIRIILRTNKVLKIYLYIINMLVFLNSKYITVWSCFDVLIVNYVMVQLTDTMFDRDSRVSLEHFQQITYFNHQYQNDDNLRDMWCFSRLPITLLMPKSFCSSQNTPPSLFLKGFW